MFAFKFIADVVFKQSHETEAAVQDLQLRSCKCVSYDCGCCLYLDLPKFKINDTGIYIGFLRNIYLCFINGRWDFFS